MKLYSFMLVGQVRWNISDGDPPSWPALVADAQLLNPLVQLGPEPRPSIFLLGDGRHHVMTNRFNVISPDLGDQLDDLLPPWLRLLRIASKQASFPTELYGFSAIDFDPTGLRPTPPAVRGKGRLIGEFNVHTALDAATIARANELQTETAVPLYHELLLDALLAYRLNRDREAILYSAIAIESLAQHELTRTYQAALRSDAPPEHMNILTFDLPGGQTTKKDPIYALLSESDNFGRLLHEAPLYLMRRSLLRDDPALFAEAKALYGTRNRISHGQAITGADENLLQLDSDGSRAAVWTAVAVFEWFGQGGYHVPDTNGAQVQIEG